MIIIEKNKHQNTKQFHEMLCKSVRQTWEMIPRGGGQDYNATPEVIATIVAWKCTEKEIYTLYGRFAGGEGSKTPTHFSKMMQNVLKPLSKIQKKRSEIFMLKTPKCYNSMNIARIAFGVVGINFWAQFTPKIKLRFFILVLPPPLDDTVSTIQ